MKKKAFIMSIVLSIGKSFWVIDCRRSGPIPGIENIISMVIVEKKATLRRFVQVDISETSVDFKSILWKR